MTRSRATIVALVALTWLAVVVALWPAHGKSLAWDEVNYANAAKAGIVANAFEQGSLPPSDFVRFALAKLANAEPPLPAWYDESSDPLMLRFHPPFGVYLIAAIAGDQTPISERLVRAAQLLGALALISAAIVAHRSLSPTPTTLGSVVVLLLAAWVCIQLFPAFSLHGWFAVWTVVTATMLAHWLARGGARSAAALGAALGAALLTLETGVVLWVAAAAAFALRRRLSGPGKATLRQLAGAFGLAVVFVAVAWPGSIVSISLFKLAAFLLQRVRVGQEYADIASGVPKLAVAWLPILVLVPFALIVVWRAGSARPQWRIYAVLCVVYVVAFSRFALQPEYLGPAAALAIPIIGLAADRSGRGPATAFAALALGAAVVAVPARWPDGADPWRADLEWLREPLQGRRTLADGAHIVRYYLGPGYDVAPVTQSHDLSVLMTRRNGRYEDLARTDVAGTVVVLKVRQDQPSPIERDLLGDCGRTDRPTIRLFDCTALRGVVP